MEFREIHKLLYTTIKVCQMQAVSGRWESSTNYVAVQKLCGEANDVFHSLNLTNKWNIPQGHREDAVVFACDNCESPTHAILNVLFHTMKQGSRRPKRHTQNLMIEVVLVVVDMDVDVDVDVDMDMVMVEVDVVVTVPILGENEVPPKVILLILVPIHLWVVSKIGMASG